MHVFYILDARKDAERAVELGSKDPRTFLRLGTALFHMKDFREAKKAFMQGKEAEAGESK